MVVLRRKSFAKDPGGLLKRAVIGILRSSSFLSVFVIIYQGAPSTSSQLHVTVQCSLIASFLIVAFLGLFCARNQALENFFGGIPKWLRAALMRKEYFWMVGFATCLSLFVEESKRRSELG